MSEREPIILLAHGSPDPRHATGIAALATRVAAAGEAAVHVAYLDHHGPTPADAARAAGRGVVVPALLSLGYHARVDVPAAIEAMQAAAPGPFRAASGLGLGRAVLDGVGELLVRAEVADVRDLHVVLALAGTTAPEALEEFSAALTVASAAVDGPTWAALASVTEPTHLMGYAGPAADGVPTVVVPVALCEGVLRDRVITAALGLGLDTVAGVLAETDSLARLVVARATQALLGTS